MDNNQKKSTSRKWRIHALRLTFLLIFLALVFLVWLFKEKRYNIISVIVAFLSCVPFFIKFEKGKNGAREAVIIAVMTAFSVIGRIIFAPIPSFKPVTAITVISGIALGAESGFLVGSLSAVVSNMYFGQGPWTPFQMVSWALIGFISGLIFSKRKKRPGKITLSLMGILGGVLFSLMMDVWTVLSIDGYFNLARYYACILTSFGTMAIYAVSNVIFLLILTNPFLSKLDRIKTKFGIFGGK